MQAGIQLKNALYSKDATLRTQHQQRWMQFPVELRAYIKKNVSCHYLCSFLLKFINTMGLWLLNKLQCGLECLRSPDVKVQHTHTQPFYGSVEFVRENPGDPVPEETFTHYSHRSH